MDKEAKDIYRRMMHGAIGAIVKSDSKEEYLIGLNDIVMSGNEMAISGFIRRPQDLLLLFTPITLFIAVNARVGPNWEDIKPCMIEIIEDKIKEVCDDETVLRNEH